jgi:exodeoxyribonuclease-1
MKEPVVNTFTFYDYETSGVNPHYDQVYQFACVKTDQFLNIIDQTEVNLYGKPRIDVLPHPKAFLTHRIDIDELDKVGLDELELAKKIQEIFLAGENNCISGYNTIAFDDELTRTLMFRNLLQPYDHEFKNGNRRFDVYNLVRLAYAFKPEVLNWPEKPDEPGTVSFKLENLSKANGITHANAHEAMSDVVASVGLARIIKQNAPKIFQHALNTTDKNNLSKLLAKKEPFFHTSSFYGKENKYTTLLLPIVMDRTNKNKLICIDLRYAPDELLTLSADDIKHYLFTKREELGNDVPVIKTVAIQLNKSPIVVPANQKMIARYASDFNLSIDEVNRNFNKVIANRDLALRIQQAYSDPKFNPPYDPFETLYSGGFISNMDGQLRADLLRTSADLSNPKLIADDLAAFTGKMQDSERQYSLAVRAKWTNFYQQIIKANIPGYNRDEMIHWVNYLNKRLVEHNGEMGLTFDTFKDALNEARIETVLTHDEEQILNKIELFVNNQRKIFDYVKKASYEHASPKKKELQSHELAP